jgi:hypothetical protein
VVSVDVGKKTQEFRVKERPGEVRPRAKNGVQDYDGAKLVGYMRV